MKVIEGHLYFIKDEFIDKYNSKYHLMENKSKTKRPSYFCFRDRQDRNILWFIPMSTQYIKYQKIYKDKKEKLKKEPNNFVFAHIAGNDCVFLLQNMFPTLEKYIAEEYYKNNKKIIISHKVKDNIMKKANPIIVNTKKGKIATLTNLPEFLKDIKKELITA